MESVRWIIDGYNLIRREPRLSSVERRQGSAAARAFLDGELSRFRARKGRGHSVLVVYDGGAASARTQVASGFQAIYSGKNHTADLVILDEARKLEGRMAVRVVTSDVQDIGGRLRGLQVSVYSTHRFAQELWPAGSPDFEEEKPKPPKGRDVDFWLREFGEEPDSEA
ncbi:MAG: NYN domain-containing protein [Planctomycetota bacterium]